jgi:hypothetical protein
LRTARVVADPWCVDAEHEHQALVEVEARLRGRFPDLDAAVVEAAVRLSYAELTGPIRDFVPLLVERAARDRLAFAVRDAPAESAGVAPAPAT